MLPVRGAREDVDCWCWRGSSRSSRLAGACKHIVQIYNRTGFEEGSWKGGGTSTIIGIYQVVVVDVRFVVVLVRIG